MKSNTWYLAFTFLIAFLFLVTMPKCDKNKQTGTTTTGPQGPAGTNGTNGRNGHNALIVSHTNDTNCANGGTLVLAGTDLNDDGVLQSSEVTASADVCNGAPGVAATPPVFTPVIVITPCGPNSSTYKEVLLGLQGGSIFAEFTGNASDATTVRNTLIPDGGYWNTDSSQCLFSVSTNGSGNRLISWNGSTNNGSGPFGAGSASYTASTQVWGATYTAPGN